jgi:dephospho-CoA kinase
LQSIRLIICVTGMPGSGKSTIGRSAKDMGFDVVSLGDIVREETIRRGLTVNGNNLSTVMIKLREELGSGAVAQLALRKILSSDGSYVLIDGVRSMSEVEVFRKVAPVKILALHASPDTRLRYLQDRGRNDAPLTRELFETRDKKELAVGICEAIALSDEAISNNNITIRELQKRAFDVIHKWMNQFED